MNDVFIFVIMNRKKRIAEQKVANDKKKGDKKSKKDKQQSDADVSDIKQSPASTVQQGKYSRVVQICND